MKVLVCSRGNEGAGAKPLVGGGGFAPAPVMFLTWEIACDTQDPYPPPVMLPPPPPPPFEPTLAAFLQLFPQ
jgi:hypothetical protein